MAAGRAGGLRPLCLSLVSSWLEPSPPAGARPAGRAIEAPWLLNGGHGASLRRPACPPEASRPPSTVPWHAPALAAPHDPSPQPRLTINRGQVTADWISAAARMDGCAPRPSCCSLRYLMGGLAALQLGPDAVNLAGGMHDQNRR
jgi:hypothetical protein